MDIVSFRNGRHLNLIGNMYVSNSKSAIIMSHGFTGDKFEWGKFDKIAYSLNHAGYNVLAFDFSGCGESDDDSLSLDKQIDDLNSAINYARNKNYQHLGLFGHSLGGLVSLRCYDENIKTIVMTAPVTDKVRYSWDKRYTKEQLEELAEKNYITKIRDKGVRRKIIIDRQMLIDRENVNQKQILEKIKCPVLILHGTEDALVPTEDSKNAMKYLSLESKLELIEKDNHSFEKLGLFLDKINLWYLKYLEL